MNNARTDCLTCPGKCIGCTNDMNDGALCDECRDPKEMVPAPDCSCMKGFVFDLERTHCDACPINCFGCSREGAAPA